MIRLVLLLLAITNSVPAYAQAWATKQHDNECQASLFYEGDTYLLIGLDWRTDTIRLSLFDPDWKSLGEQSSVHLEFEMVGNVEYERWYGDAAVLDLGNGMSALSMSWERKYKDDFINAWALANGFRLRADELNLGGYSLKGSKAAFERILECQSKALRNDRSDPFASLAKENPDGLKAVDVQATGDVRALFSTDDYPSRALRNGAEGSVVAKLQIGPDGRVKSCNVQESSGDIDLDQATCQILQRRARFKPALDSVGNPTAGEYLTPRIAWSVGK